MAFGRRLKKQSANLTEQAVETGEGAIAAVGEAVGEYLRRQQGKPASSGGDNALAFVAGLLFGGLVAGTAAILAAPTDGYTLRRRLREKWDEFFGGELGTTDAPAAPGQPFAAQVVPTTPEAVREPAAVTA
ncbi:MAG: hypothetical protein HY332_07735 [Chloroflexi bacterium]|nr:hypothetical protein [Chloroflexota bacterium]